MINKTLGEKIEFEDKIALSELKSIYQHLLSECMHARFESSDIAEKYTTRAMTYLENTDFFVAPASTIYHGSFRGGLIIHHIEVYNQICDLIKLPCFQSVTPASAYLVSLIHDWCKIDKYEAYNRNVKNEKTGRWEQVESFRCRKDMNPYPFGHGELSMFLGQRFFNLTVEECLAIRWHMGVWQCHEALHSDLQHSNELYPIVHLLQFADQLSITSYVDKIGENN